MTTNNSADREQAEGGSKVEQLEDSVGAEQPEDTRKDVSPTESEEREDTPDPLLSQGYGSDASLNDKFEMRALETKQIYANRAINLAKIRCFGFDMDYTLCEYISPDFDILAFDLAKNHLVSRLGYPKEILQLPYDPRFPVRGLWFDRQWGNLLKVDQLGKILRCTHGFREVHGAELRNMYPHKLQKRDESRVFIMNTLFNLAETHLVASLVDYYDRQKDAEKMGLGWRLDGKEITFKQLFQDLRGAIDHIHWDSTELKSRTIADLPRYVRRDARLPRLLANLREEGRKVFLLTNSDWWYSSHIMSYLLSGSADRIVDWLSYFDLTIVDAKKPAFFSSQEAIRRIEVPASTNHQVFSGGNHATVTEMLGAEGPEIIYCGDHLYADVVRCRKLCEWRTLLVVPELEKEVMVSQEQTGLLYQLNKMEALLSLPQVDLASVRERLWECVKRLDNGYGHSGSLFRAGSRLTYFGAQMLTWADLYTGSVGNLAEYSLEQRFLPLPSTLPHERPGAYTIHAEEEIEGDISTKGMDFQTGLVFH